MTSGKPTLKDIAEATGLSISTVSRALRGHDAINIETRRQVERVASEINYPMGVREQTGGHGVATAADEAPVSSLGFKSLAVVLRGPHMGRFFGESVMALFELGGTLGFTVEIVHSDPSQGLAEVLAGVKSDAAVVFSMERVEFSEEPTLETVEVPFLLVNRHAEDACSSVTLDDFSAGVKAARYLYRLGHRRIGYMPGSWMGTAPREREMGFRAGLEMNRCYDPAYFSAPVAGDHIEPVRRHVKKLLTMAEPATALVTYNDSLAATALVALRDAGLRIPEDFSVVGFDHYPEFHHAKLTTFDYRYRDIAEHAVYLLDGLVTGKVTGPTRVCLMPRFIPGETSGPAPNTNSRPAV